MEKNFVEYDLLVSKLATNLLSYSKRHNNEMRIKYTPKDKNCLFVLKVAQIVSQLSSSNVIIEYPWYKKIFHRTLWKVKSKKSLEDVIDYEDFLNFTFKGSDITPIEVYEEYYE